MKKLTLPLLLGVLMISAAIWMITGPGSAPAVDAADPIGSAGRASGGRPNELTGDRHPGEDRTPARDDRGDSRAGRRGNAKIKVRGRCVTAENLLPLSGCEIDVAGVRRRFAQQGSAPPPATSAPTTYSGADGRFEVELELPSRHHIRLRTRANGRADMQGFLAPRGGVAEAGDIPIPAGAHLIARIVDRRGVPQSGVGFRLYRAIRGGRATVSPLNWLTYESDGAGVAESDIMLAGGIWNLTPQGGVKILEPGARFEIPADTAIFTARFVVERPDPKAMITGTLVDDEGRGVPNIAIQADDGSKWPIGYGTSDAKGVFQVRCRTKPDKPVQLVVPRAAGFETLRSAETFAWGSTNVVIALARAGSLIVKVTEDGGDRPIENYRVVWFKVADSGVRGFLGGREPMGHHPGGETTVQAVPAGRIRIVVMPQGKTYAPNDPHEFEKPPGDAQIQISLGTRVELPVAVVDEADKPIAGTRLQLVRSADDKPVTLKSYAVDHSQYPQFSHPNSYVLLLDTVVTDKFGSAVVRWPASDDRLAIRALGPGHVPMVHEPVSIGAANRPLKIVVSRGATLSGSVAPLAVLHRLTAASPKRKFAPQAPAILITYRGTQGPQGAQRTRLARIDANGQFRILGLHRGTWDVSFRVWRIGASRGARVARKAFAPVDLRADEDRRVSLDISDMQPSTLRGRILVNGTPWVAKDFVLHRVTRLPNGELQIGVAMNLTTDDRGSFAAESIQPGRYMIGVDNKAGGLRPGWLRSATTVDVPPGGDVDEIFRIESGTLRVHLVGGDGKPVRNQYVTVRHKMSASRTGAATGKYGWMEIDPIATGVYTIGIFPRVKAEPGRLRAPRANREILLGEVTVTAGSSASEITLRMPDLDAKKGKQP